MNQDIRVLIFVIITIVKVIVMIGGIFLILKNLIIGFRNNRSEKKRKALKYFLLVFVAMVGLTVLEFGIAFIFPE